MKSELKCSVCLLILIGACSATMAMLTDNPARAVLGSFAISIASIMLLFTAYSAIHK